MYSKRTKIQSLSLTALLLFGAASSLVSAKESSPNVQPNIVILFADDMGYGDIEAYNPDSKIPTPNLNKMAADGMAFTDAHTSSAVCTPSRYSILTGRYAWRTHLKRGVLRGHSPALIEPSRTTIASMLQSQGYNTIAVGKWHIGIGQAETDYWGKIKQGPNSVGFDYFFGIPASLDMEPYVYIENESLATPLTGKIIEASRHRRQDGEGFWRKGLVGEGFEHQDVLSTLTNKAMDQIELATQDPEKKPFFLYYALPAPHTPWLPSKASKGQTGAGYYGDFVVDVDNLVGQVNNKLKELNIADNTIVIYSSDNGAHWGESDKKKYGHLANGKLRGQKADIHEGGHRVPLIINWPGKVAKGKMNSSLLVLNDLMATLAAITNTSIQQVSGLDSVDFSTQLLSQANSEHDRGAVIHHSFQGMFAIRKGDWKLIDGAGSGGFTRIKPDGNSMQLYNLKDDPAETTNLVNKYPVVVNQLMTELKQIRGND
ncbi:arylsulfatase [Paraglaciecola sp. L3A3]|uniref:sulfatase family protein n=1 Tax=Paraglaciecola sp. L3A3 TaxID=2686358 RepID=UPI00131ECA7C|nr:arylsulfatase [Paraglaciecola sp. L3A3]